MRFNEFEGNEEAKRPCPPVWTGAASLMPFIGGAQRQRPPDGGAAAGEGGGMHRSRQGAAALRPLSRLPQGGGGGHPDIEEAGGDGGVRSFHIEEVRRLRDTAYVLPNEAAYRVLILSEAQNMTEQAQNALLKILEEPPRHVIFLLTCENRRSCCPPSNPA